MLNCAVIYPLGDKLQLGSYANSQAGARAMAGVQASPASASEACTPQFSIALNTLGASSQAPETLIRPRKLFTTENTKDTERIILSTQAIRIFVFSATAPALLYLLHPCKSSVSSVVTLGFFLKPNAFTIGVGRNKPIRATARIGVSGNSHPNSPETPALADAGRTYSGLLRDMPFASFVDNLIP